MQQLGGNLQNKHRIYYDNRIFATITTILGRPFHKVYEDFIGIFGLPSKIKFVGSDSDVDVCSLIKLFLLNLLIHVFMHLVSQQQHKLLQRMFSLVQSELVAGFPPLCLFQFTFHLSKF